ncbi:MAG: hypothetical protein KF723_21710 [Rhizobiaceae bacterium]|nr:hypothetical protein [Rhizobiaceae bacterium]
MPKRDEILALERGFWTGNSQFFKDNADSACLVAFPDMAGVMDRKDLAATATNPHRWSDLEIELKGFFEPQDGVVFMAYEASATRDNGEPYKALVSSGYLRRADGWKLAFHSQTPLQS